MKCSKKYCRHDVRAKGLCGRHYLQQFRAADPVKYAYQTLKDNAKRRGKLCTITLDQFRSFCSATPYMKGKGRTATSFHLDRIIEENGYTIDNIQVLQNAANVQKFLRYSHDSKGKPQHFTVITITPSSSDCPF